MSAWLPSCTGPCHFPSMELCPPSILISMKCYVLNSFQWVFKGSNGTISVQFSNNFKVWSADHVMCQVGVFYPQILHNYKKMRTNHLILCTSKFSNIKQEISKPFCNEFFLSITFLHLYWDTQMYINKSLLI